MATPSAAQARSHHAEQAAVVAAAIAAVREMFSTRVPLPEIVARIAAYQFDAAVTSARAIADMADAADMLTRPRVFAGVSSKGFPIAEPIIATIDARVPAPVEPFPDAWWDAEIDKFLPAVEQLVESEVRDAGRTASQVEFVTRPEWTNYVRMLIPPSCDRCTILAGRIYRDLEEFDRHPPTCDCVMVPVEDWESAHDKGYVSSFEEAFERGDVRGLSEADAQAIRDGADPVKVVNAKRGMTSPTVFGHRVKATTVGTTKRAAWRKANPTRPVRLRPETIYRLADGNRDEALRLLSLYGYLA